MHDANYLWGKAYDNNNNSWIALFHSSPKRSKSTSTSSTTGCGTSILGFSESHLRRKLFSSNSRLFFFPSSPSAPSSAAPSLSSSLVSWSYCFNISLDKNLPFLHARGPRCVYARVRGMPLQPLYAPPSACSCVHGVARRHQISLPWCRATT